MARPDPSLSRGPATRQGPDRRAAPLLAAALALTASRILEPASPRGSLLVAGRRVPELCPIRRLTGRRCPGCGMTRGCVYALRLDLRSALRANPLSPLMVLLGVRSLAVALSRSALR